MAVNKERQALERGVISALLANGYVKAKGQKCLKRIGEETDVFVYPGVRSKSTILELRPVVGFVNTTLKSRLQASGKHDADFRVANTLIGNIPGVSELWGDHFTLWISKGQPTAPMIELFMTAMETIVCPRLAAYDSVDRVIDLLERYIASLDDRDLVVAEAAEKLAILRSN